MLSERQSKRDTSATANLDDIPLLNPGLSVGKQVDVLRRAAMRAAVAEDAPERIVCRRIDEQMLSQMEAIKTRLQKAGWDCDWATIIVPDSSPVYLLIVGRHEDLRFLRRDG